MCSLVACITGNDEIGDLAQLLSCLSDLVYCKVCACLQILLIGSDCLWDCPLSYNFMNILPEDILLEKFSCELQTPLLKLFILVQCWLNKSSLFGVEFRVRKKDLGFSS
ncbi:hypothetical protein NC653_006668 [Populus alba x Populus x berolinensis]|uniref:Uncharacterized protein n=1 Tax=Populus alba x Populus x berolinensis TaxID=444605 RepID=A0AAD6RFH7_9ROSI|nr:hypothetical protein NC653_006668 [Populus alba x Populus x berolinensis]